MAYNNVAASAHFHPALIPQARELCQLAGVYRGSLPDGDWLSQEKVDGFRCLYFTGRDGRKRLWTRNGIPIEGTGHILHRLNLMEQAAGEPMMFDGEYVVGGTLAATKAWCERDWKGGGEAGTLHLFDCMTLAEWQGGGTERPLHERLRMLDRIKTDADALPEEWAWREETRGAEPPQPHVTVLASEYVADHNDAMNFAKSIWSKGGEGAVIKCATSPYLRERSNQWLKIK